MEFFVIPRELKRPWGSRRTTRNQFIYTLYFHGIPTSFTPLGRSSLLGMTFAFVLSVLSCFCAFVFMCFCVFRAFVFSVPNAQTLRLGAARASDKSPLSWPPIPDACLPRPRGRRRPR